MDATILVNNIAVNFLGKEKITTFEEKLLINNSKLIKFNDYAKLCIIEGTILMIVGMIIGGLYLRTKPEAFIGIGIIGFIAPFLINYIYQDLIFERIKRKKETLLPDLLLEASVFCDETSLMNTIQKISEQDFGELSVDFLRAKKEIQKGASIEEALNRIKQYNKSKIYDRVIDLLLQGYKSGADISDALKETAEDILENQAILKERQAVMLVTKYTLLVSAGIIVPAIIGTIIGLVSEFNIGSAADIGFGLSFEDRTNLFNTTKFGAFFYIIEYSILSSYFLGLSENNKKNFFIYATIILPVALIIFFIAQTL